MSESDPSKVFILGCGSVGSALAIAFARGGVPISGAHCRSAPSAAAAERLVGFGVSHGDIPDAISEAGTIIIAVPDPTIPSVSEELASSKVIARHQVALHCSGSRSSDDLDTLRPHLRGVGSFHPLLSFADPKSASELLPKAAFAIEGDRPALRASRKLASSIGGFCLEIEAKDRVLYHAAAATASNHLVALASQAASCLFEIGVERGLAIQALLPLMRSTLNNLDHLGLPKALTGPVSRGDADAVEAHLQIIAHRAPSELEPYEVLAREALIVAREQGQASTADLERVAALLEERGKKNC